MIKTQSNHSEELTIKATVGIHSQTRFSERFRPKSKPWSSEHKESLLLLRDSEDLIVWSWNYVRVYRGSIRKLKVEKHQDALHSGAFTSESCASPISEYKPVFRVHNRYPMPNLYGNYELKNQTRLDRWSQIKITCHVCFRKKAQSFRFLPSS